MRAGQLSWSSAAGWSGIATDQTSADLVLFFGQREALTCGTRYGELRATFPRAHILGCSTGGQIHDDDVGDDGVCALALSFDATTLRAVCLDVAGPDASRDCGLKLGKALDRHDLAGVFVLSDGLKVNGSALVAGIAEVIGDKVPVAGGLAGDGADFAVTLTGCDAPPRSGQVAAIGFYGDAIRIGHGYAGGWSVFGPRRRITRSKANVLYELDGKPALDLYERYLGEDDARGLPGTGLLYPIRITDPVQPDHDVVRTILAVDREARSMTFAGDMPTGWDAQLMRGNFDSLVSGAAEAARKARLNCAGDAGYSGAALLVSCIGRRMLMGQRVIDEVEAAGSELGDSILRLGFYSYGEISPHAATGACELHNQTMTAIVFSEAAG